MALSRVVSEIFNVEKYRDKKKERKKEKRKNPGQGSVKVIESGTIR